MRQLALGDSVFVCTAFDGVKRATVDTVPEEWRSPNHPIITSKGAFPKVWVVLDGYTEARPWPLTDVFHDEIDAQARQRSIEAERSTL